MDSGAGDEEAALSDFEEDDLEPAAVVLPAAVAPAPAQNTNADSLKIALAELEDERQARKIAEAAKAEADTATARLKTMIHEAIRQREEALRTKEERSKQLEEALRTKEERSKQLEEAIQLKEDITRNRDEIGAQRDELQKQRDDLNRARDSAKAETDGVARILVTQAEKVASMSKTIKSFSGVLPRVPKSTGLAAIALGFSKRVEEIIEEALKQRDDALRQKDELHNQMDQRNFTIAIEVSQLEASNKQLEDEVGKKSSELEKCQKLVAEKDDKVADMERATTEQLAQLAETKQEVETLMQRVEEAESGLDTLNSERDRNIESAGRAKASLMEILGLMHSGSPLVSEQNGEASPEDDNDNERKSSSEYGQEIIHLAGKLVALWNENRLRAEKERKDFESTVRILHAEKGNILQKLSFPDQVNGTQRDSDGGQSDGVTLSHAHDATLSHTDDATLLHTDDANGVPKDHVERYQIIGEGPKQTFLKLLQAELAAQEKRNEQTATQVSLLERDIEHLQQEIKRAASASREEIDRLQQQLATQARDLEGKNRSIFELNKNVEDLTTDLLAAEDEVVRWKDAATAEAAAGAEILEEVEARNKEVAALSEKVVKFRELMEEANTKVGSKEDMAMAAIAALNAAERSRQIADERAAELRFRIDEMNKQLEELEQRSERRACNLFDIFGPWLRWRSNRPGEDPQRSAEMEELLEPLV